MDIRRSIIRLITLAACLGLTTAALAENDAYMRIKGKTMDIKGGVTMKGREGTIIVHAMEQSVVVPIDAASGMVSGKRVHKPIVITKEIDRSSPLLHQALAQNEVLAEVTLQFYALVGGVERNTYTIVLKNARISGLRHVMEDNNKAELAKLPAYEELSLVYESITWTWNDGSVTSTDSAATAR